MIDKQAIAQHLKINETQIKSIDEWANCLFVVVAGKGARFVSKKVGIMHRTEQAQQIENFFLKKLEKEYCLSNKEEVLENLKKCSDQTLIIHGNNFKTSPNLAYGSLSLYLKVRTNSIF